MKKTIILFCALFMTAAAFSQSLFDYVPHTSGSIVGPDDFAIKISGNGSSYSITNRRGSVDIIAVKGEGTCVHFAVRLRAADTTGPARYYKISVYPPSQAVITEYSGTPDLTGFWCFRGTTNDDSINYRDTPGLSGNKTGQYQKGNQVDFTGWLDAKSALDSSEDYWYSFNAGGETAWMYGRYISFPNSVLLTASLFSKPCVVSPSTLAAAALEARSKAAADILKTMDMETARAGDAAAFTTQVFDTGVSTVTISNNGSGEYDYPLFTYKSGNITKEIKLDWYYNWQYVPDAGLLFYLTDSQLHCFDCKTGTEYQEGTALEFGSLYIEYSVFAVNTAGDKVAYLDAFHGRDYTPVYTIQVYNLKSGKTTSYDLPSYPAKLGWSDDDTIFYLTNEYTYYDAMEYTIGYISLSDGLDQTSHYFTLYGDYETPDIQYTILMLPAKDPDKILLFLGDGISYLTDLRISHSSSSWMDYPLEMSYFINQFWYEGAPFLAFIERDEDNRQKFDVVIYNTGFNQIKRQSFTAPNILDEVNWVGVRDGKIIVSLELVK